MKLIALFTLALASTANAIILHGDGKKIDGPLPDVYSNDEFMQEFLKKYAEKDVNGRIYVSRDNAEKGATRVLENIKGLKPYYAK